MAENFKHGCPLRSYNHAMMHNKWAHKQAGSYPGDEYKFISNGRRGSYRGKYDLAIDNAFDADGGLLPDYESYWDKVK